MPGRAPLAAGRTLPPADRPVPGMPQPNRPDLRRAGLAERVRRHLVGQPRSILASGPTSLRRRRGPHGVRGPPRGRLRLTSHLPDRQLDLRRAVRRQAVRCQAGQHRARGRGPRPRRRDGNPLQPRPGGDRLRPDHRPSRPPISRRMRGNRASRHRRHHRPGGGRRPVRNPRPVHSRRPVRNPPAGRHPPVHSRPGGRRVHQPRPRVGQAVRHDRDGRPIRMPLRSPAIPPASPAIRRGRSRPRRRPASRSLPRYRMTPPRVMAGRRVAR